MDDVLVLITRVRHEQCGTLATRVDFEARADDGRELLGSLYTSQDFDDVVKLIEDALDAGELIEIRGRQAATRVPGTSRFGWFTLTAGLSSYRALVFQRH